MFVKQSVERCGGFQREVQWRCVANGRWISKETWQGDKSWAADVTPFRIVSRGHVTRRSRIPGWPRATEFLILSTTSTEETKSLERHEGRKKKTINKFKRKAGARAG